jgi:flagellar hook-associated protein 2
MEISGFDADSLVTQLMQIERIPLTALQTRKDAAKTASDAIAKIRTNLDAFRLAAAKLAETSNFARYKTAVSDSAVATASVSGTANVGSLTFAVDRLAQAHGLRSVGTVATDTTVVTAASFLSVATGTRSIGIETVRAGSGLTAGSITVEVTQASAGATATGTALGVSTTITAGVNDTVAIDVNGASRTVTIAAGTYTAAQLTSAVQAGFDASGGGVSAELDGSGALQLTTAREGSSASLQITGGTALADLGLAVQATAVNGTDGIIDVGGTTTTVTNAVAGQAVAVDTGSGTLDVTLSGGLRIGDTTVTTVSTGSRTLADVASAISSSNGGVSAAAVRVGDGAWRLQLTSRTTGEDGRLAIDTSVLTGLGGMIESSAAQNARITIGEGVGAYQVEASTNTFSSVLGGVAITAKTVSATPVTVDVSRNDDAIATDLAALVGAANTLLAEIKVQTRFDATSGSKGTLVGNSAVRRLADEVRTALSAQVGGLSSANFNGLATSVGIERTRDGSFTFDKAEFLDAMAADPTTVSRMFARGGSGTGSVTFGTATAETRAGAYDVAVTTAATQATSGTLFDGGAAAPTRIGVRIGSTTATVDVTAGQSTAQIITALNDAFVANGFQLTAETDGTGLRIRSDEWGSSGNFDLNLDLAGAGTWTDVDGINVAGTINGAAASGIGRQLSLSNLLDDQPAAGLAVEVPGGVTGAIGTFTYQPGFAARVVEFATAVTADESGMLSTVKSGYDRRVEEYTDQMTRLEDRLLIRETNLRRQYSNLQTLLGNLQNQGTWLSSQISSLPSISQG